jgi:putative membrane protein
MGAVTMLGSVVADRYRMMDDGNGWGWLGVGMMLLLVVAVVGLVAWVIIRSTTQGNRPQPHDRAREILAERLARGEITPDEYRERAQHLT